MTFDAFAYIKLIFRNKTTETPFHLIFNLWTLSTNLKIAHDVIAQWHIKIESTNTLNYILFSISMRIFLPNQPITPSTCAHVLTYGQTFDAALYLSCSVKLGKTEFLAKTKQWQKVRAPNECIGKCRRNQWQWSRSTRAKVKRTRVSSWHNRQSIIINCLQRFFFLLQFAAQAKLSFMRNFPLW